MTTRHEGSNDWRSAAKTKRVRGLIATRLNQLFETYNDTAIAVHLINILRSKGKIEGSNLDGTPKYRDPYHLKDEELLKDLENYEIELEEKLTEDE
jgi:hypothetical protein